MHAIFQWQDTVSTVPLSLRNWKRSYMDDLANRVTFANHYSTPLSKVPEAKQILEGKDYFGLSCIVTYAGTAVYH